MTANHIEYTDALDLVELEDGSICVKSNCDLKEGDLVATIPKQACLTTRASGAAAMIEAARLDGCFGLCVAVMYERSLGSESPWAGYLQILPFSEPLPLLWTLDEVDSLLRGTELHQTIKEDKELIYEDWKQCILPLVHSEEFTLDPNYFRVEDYFAAKSLVASRSFQIDDYFGFGMVPLADLFNHKTGAEDVHFTSAPSLDESDESAESVTDDENDCNDEEQIPTPQPEENVSSARSNDEGSSDGRNSECSEDMTGNPVVLEMILVKDVKAGTEVFNTYGSMGNAALLHRYGFTELDNPYDIVNIDLDLVVQWSSSLFSGRHRRSRLSLWRKLGHAGCVSQNSEYFEISFDGEPQLELLILLYVILLSEEDYLKLDLISATSRNDGESATAYLPKTGNFLLGEISEMSRETLLTMSVCEALLSLADMRESLYGTTSLEDDIESLKRSNCITERRLYHSLVLRISERHIIEKLRNYTKKSSQSVKGLHSRKRLKS